MKPSTQPIQRCTSYARMDFRPRTRLSLTRYAAGMILRFFFVSGRTMSAIVEICWGEDAWRKVKEAIPTARLIRFPLWGEHKDIRLYLELDNSGKSLKRFVFWVHHPQMVLQRQALSQCCLRQDRKGKNLGYGY
ncbi:hypothetical protein BJY01DRAFT_206864 [Aspergillus pseudoustus]|uniref:Uncharacterized protein n=1 Tax=Aspergillus pseudoustus TaxID=1810923 RepID=A0ABR4KM35_9EURO